MPPYTFDHAVLNGCLSLVWLLVWEKEREYDTLCRYHAIREHMHQKLHELHAELIKKLREE